MNNLPTCRICGHIILLTPHLCPLVRITNCFQHYKVEVRGNTAIFIYEPRTYGAAKTYAHEMVWKDEWYSA